MAYLNIAPVANTALVINRRIPLSTWVNSILSMQKTLLTKTNVVLRFWTNNVAKMGFYTTTPNTPNLNVTAITSTTMTMNGISLDLCIEENLQIVQSLAHSINTGQFRMPILYPVIWRTPVPAGQTSGSVNIPLTKGYGRLIKSMVTCVLTGSQTAQYAYSPSNWNGSKIATLTTQLNNRQLQSSVINCFNPNAAANPGGFTYPTAASGGTQPSMDYRNMRPYLLGSAISSYPMYATNWVWADQWSVQSSINKLKQQLPDESVEDGEILRDSNNVYSMLFTCPYNANGASETNANGGMAVYTFGVFLKTLSITDQGVYID
jgi:hypothetical protein